MSQSIKKIIWICLKCLQWAGRDTPTEQTENTREKIMRLFPVCVYQSLEVTVNHTIMLLFSSVEFSSVAQPWPTLCDPMNRSTPGLPVHHQLPKFTQSHMHRVSDAIQASHPLSSPSPLAPNPSQHQSLFQWVNSLHEVAKVLEFQL